MSTRSGYVTACECAAWNGTPVAVRTVYEQEFFAILRKMEEVDSRSADAILSAGYYYEYDEAQRVKEDEISKVTDECSQQFEALVRRKRQLLEKVRRARLGPAPAPVPAATV